MCRLCIIVSINCHVSLSSTLFFFSPTNLISTKSHNWISGIMVKILIVFLLSSSDIHGRRSKKLSLSEPQPLLYLPPLKRWFRARRKTSYSKKELHNLKLDFPTWITWVALLVGRSRDRSPVMSLQIFFHGSFRENHVSWDRISLWKWVPGISPGIKAVGAFGWRPTTLVVPKVEKIRGLNLPGTPKTTSACRGIPLLYFIGDSNIETHKTMTFTIL